MYGIFTYIYHRIQPNVGKYTSSMDPMANIYKKQSCGGKKSQTAFSRSLFFEARTTKSD